VVDRSSRPGPLVGTTERAMAEGHPAVASVGVLVRELEQVLSGQSGPMARREAQDIVAALLDVPRSWPVQHRDDPADAELSRRARAAAEARTRGMPLAYAVGRAAFRHLTLEVDERVLIPRPETEGLVEIIIERGISGGLAIDVGTGSGAIALALAQEGRFDHIIGTDVSSGALDVARANADRLRRAISTPVEFRAGADLAPVRGFRARAIVSNPPYISWGEAAGLPSSVRDWEPAVALFSGESGLCATTVLVREAADVLEPGGMLALEIDARRAAAVAELVVNDGRYTAVAVRTDLFGRERFVTAMRRTGDQGDAGRQSD
jgi:release factor glutamine methyltransferase